MHTDYPLSYGKGIFVLRHVKVKSLRDSWKNLHPFGVVFFHETLPLAQHEPLLAVRKWIVRFHNNLIISNMTATGKKTTIAEVEQWWSQADFTIMEIVTGFQASDFVSETGSQDFVDACNEHWTQMNNEDKIIVRKTFKSLELEKSTITQANKWWDETDFEQMALITGLRQHEFDAEDGYQEFVDACDNSWNQLSNSEKIRVWNKYK